MEIEKGRVKTTDLDVETQIHAKHNVLSQMVGNLGTNVPITLITLRDSVDKTVFSVDKDRLTSDQRHLSL